MLSLPWRLFRASFLARDIQPTFLLPQVSTRTAGALLILLQDPALRPWQKSPCILAASLESIRKSTDWR
jgi:hypothetical protein